MDRQCVWRDLQKWQKYWERCHQPLKLLMMLKHTWWWNTGPTPYPSIIRLHPHLCQRDDITHAPRVRQRFQSSDEVIWDLTPVLKQVLYICTVRVTYATREKLTVNQWARARREMSRSIMCESHLRDSCTETHVIRHTCSGSAWHYSENQTRPCPAKG